MTRAMCNVTLSAALCAAFLGAFAAPAAAQDPKVAVTGGLDFTNQYNFRGIRQNAAGMAIFPFVDAGIPVFSGDGGLKSVSINLGSWNSFHTDQYGDAVEDEDTWYESDFYATLGLGLGKTALAFTYTAYMSPAEGALYFATVHELAVKATFDDSGLGKGSVKPYALVAFELGDAGADGGTEKGTYIELGMSPGYTGYSKAAIAFPIKVGLSANDYYKFPTSIDDDFFGFFSIGGLVTVPMGSNWNIHGGAELQVFGDNVKAYNAFGDDGDSSTAGIYSIGIGFSY